MMARNAFAISATIKITRALAIGVTQAAVSALVQELMNASNALISPSHSEMGTVPNRASASQDISLMEPHALDALKTA